MAIQEYYYFNGVGVYYFLLLSSDKFFISLLFHTFLSLLLAIDFCYTQLIFFCFLFKKDKINK